MSNLLFWLGIGAAQKSAGSKAIERRHRAPSVVVGTLLALLIAVGMFVLLVSQQWPKEANLWRDRTSPGTASKRLRDIGPTMWEREECVSPTFSHMQSEEGRV
jgi:hypothetical protein